MSTCTQYCTIHGLNHLIEIKILSSFSVFNNYSFLQFQKSSLACTSEPPILLAFFHFFVAHHSTPYRGLKGDGWRNLYASNTNFVVGHSFMQVKDKFDPLTHFLMGKVTVFFWTETWYGCARGRGWLGGAGRVGNCYA